MPENILQPNVSGDKKSSWRELFQQGRGPYTVLLNLGISLHAIDIFIITTVMPTVVEDIGGLRYYTWTSMLYMVGTIVGAAAGSQLRDQFGARLGYFWGGMLLLIGTIGCAISPDMLSLLIARILKGVGGGLVISQSMSLVSDLYSPKIRLRILATISTTWSVAALFGPGVGGLFAELNWWRGAFWSQAPFIILFLWMALKFVPNSEKNVHRRRFPWKRLSLLAGGVVAVGISSQFKQPIINIALIATALTVVWLTFKIDSQSKAKLFPLGALSLFTPVGLAYWSYFLISVTHTTLLIFTPLFLQVLHQVTPLYVGYLSLVFSIGWTIGSVVASGWSGWKERWAGVGGMLMATLATLAFSVSVLSGTILMATIWISFIGLGIGVTNVLMTNFGMSVPLKGEEAVTSGSMPTIRSLGVAFGAAAAGLVANSVGLSEGTSHEIVTKVATWTLGLTVLIPVLTACVCLRAVTWGWHFRTRI